MVKTRIWTEILLQPWWIATGEGRGAIAAAMGVSRAWRRVGLHIAAIRRVCSAEVSAGEVGLVQTEFCSRVLEIHLAGTFDVGRGANRVWARKSCTPECVRSLIGVP